MRQTSIAKHYQIIDLKESHFITSAAFSTQLGARDNSGCGFRGTPSSQERTAPIITWWLPCLSWTQSCVRRIVRCVTKLKLNLNHWDQSLHRHPPITYLRGPRGNPVLKCHQVQSLGVYQDFVQANKH